MQTIEVTPYQNVQKILDDKQTMLKSDEVTQIVFTRGHYYQRLHIVGQHLEIKSMGPVVIDYALGADALGHNQTFNTATVLVEGEHILFNGLTFQNSAGLGSKVGQAVAVYANGDHIDFTNCSFLGFQDTVCFGPIIHMNRDNTVPDTPVAHRKLKDARYQLNDCYIEGNIDYIFGGGSVWIKNSTIQSLLSKTDPEEGYVCAPCTDQERKFGFIFDHCRIMTAPGVQNHFLGRPWRPYAKAYYVDCQLGEGINSQGWHLWGDDPHSADVADFREYDCQPSGKRPSWAKVYGKEDQQLMKEIDEYFNGEQHQ